MKNDSAALEELRNFLLDKLNYYQTLVCYGRIDLLSFMSVIHSCILLSGSVACYDDVKNRWFLV